MNRRICIVTGTRAEYGLLRPLLQDLRDAPSLAISLIATGMHLSPEFGLTYKEIEQDGHHIAARVEMLLSADTGSSLAKSTGLGMIGFSDAYSRLAPNLVVVLGDRFEVFSAAAAAMLAGIPIAHLHGGETTEGAFDESIRHSITKMSHLHFVAAEEYRQRVIQLGEQPERVFLVGGLGIDAIKRLSLMDRPTLEASLGWSLGHKSLLVTFHPVTLEHQSSAQQMVELLAALDQLRDTQLIFTMPNADTGGRELTSLVNEFVSTHANARAFTSLGHLRYLSCMRLVDGVVGNSSSGLAEAPSLGIGTVNIGDRQRGRLRAQSVLDCTPQRDTILASINRLYDPEFKRVLATTINPYGDGGASRKIVQILRDHPLEGILKKPFHNLIAAT